MGLLEGGSASEAREELGVVVGFDQREVLAPPTVTQAVDVGLAPVVGRGQTVGFAAQGRGQGLQLSKKKPSISKGAANSKAQA